MSAAGARRGPPWATWVALALLVTPLLELYVVIQVGEVIGAWPTIVLLVAESALGAYLLRREGPAAWRRLRAALGQGRIPSGELADAALLLVGGTLLLTPGFLTDVVGFFCVLPPTRPLARRALLRALRRRVVVKAFPGAGTGGFGPAAFGSRGFGRMPHGGDRRTGPDVVRGEVVDADDAEPDAKGPTAPGG